MLNEVLGTIEVSITSSKFLRFQTQFQNLESFNTAHLVYGNRDGGGDPLNKVLENLSQEDSAAPFIGTKGIARLSAVTN